VSAQSIERTYERDVTDEALIDQRYRRQIVSWPAADDVLMTAMYAMVKVKQTT
jgi:hypothetical protein